MKKFGPPIVRSLLSVPSKVKLFDRARLPLTDSVTPLLLTLPKPGTTPGASRANVSIPPPAAFEGSSSTLRVSKLDESCERTNLTVVATASHPTYQWFKDGSLVSAQLALALVLLTGAGLLIRSFVRLQTGGQGFRTEQLLTASIALPESQYQGDTKARDFYQNLLPKLAALPATRAYTPRPAMLVRLLPRLVTVLPRFVTLLPRLVTLVPSASTA